jgi:cell division protein FtsL
MAKSVRQFKETIEFRSLPLHRLRSHRYFAAAVIAAVVLVAACIHVWQRVVVINLVKEVSALDKENRSLVDDAHKIQTDIAALSMATRIELYALDTLGLQRVRADHLYTLIPEATREFSSDDLTTMISSIKRVAECLPVLTEAQAAAQELQPIRFEPADNGEGQR